MTSPSPSVPWSRVLVRFLPSVTSPRCDVQLAVAVVQHWNWLRFAAGQDLQSITRSGFCLFTPLQMNLAYLPFNRYVGNH